LVPDPAEPQSYNRYSYVLNAPLNFTDPSGHAYTGECGPTDNCLSDPDDWAVNAIEYFLNPPPGSNAADSPWVNYVLHFYASVEETLTPAERSDPAVLQEVAAGAIEAAPATSPMQARN
ncbi:MAG: hypothetical protein ACRDIB_11835, partial [Ardenticatenaceae bacterium]